MASKKNPESWERALEELNRKYFLSQIAHELNISRRTIQRWKNGGGKPDLVNYHAIMKLHARVFK